MADLVNKLDPPGHEPDAVARAREYGIDVTLIEANLRRTVTERLRALEANAEFIRGIRQRRTV